MAETDNDDLISILQNEEEEEEEHAIPADMPLLPVRDVVIFTDMLLPLFVGRKKSVQAVENAMNGDGFLMLATQKEPGQEKPGADDIHAVGTIGRVLRMLKLPDGRIKALIQGVTKAAVTKYMRKRDYFHVKVDVMEETLPENLEKNVEVQALMRNVRENSEKILSYRGEMSGEIATILESIDHPGRLADLVASNLRLKMEEAQAVLEVVDAVDRLRVVNDLLSREVELSSMQARIQSNVKDEISKSQRDYYLREQVRAIHRELGELDDKTEEIEEYRKKIKKARMPREAGEEADKQLRRLEQMHPESAETTVIRTYLDWLTDMPWQKSTRDMLDIKNARKVLDQDHYGLNRIKDRILEYLSVRKLNPAVKGPILCFVGPPGVGKTSLGRAIARAMKRKFVRISLGGVRDEAEIRGHRRTYIGAMPGRILQGLKQAGANNPVFMMDEIDKIGADYRGDPSAALLEALDPEQNESFSDHYLNLRFDLSRVMFILTANHTDTIPSALLDRMEIIRLAGYTTEEKQAIAAKHLIPRQVKENGLKPRQFSISETALLRLITEYTAEAGLRNLERGLGSLCRKIARKIAEGEKGSFPVTKAGLRRYLGPPRFQPEMDQEDSQVGLATGLAWTEAGGEVLYIEAAFIPGKGDMILTGQIGEVMQESARAALSYVRARMEALGGDGKIFDASDIHIHIPAGAVPKDGPSAGIAMATAMISIILDRPVDKMVAMTGEITLRGRVLPIGGLKEKALGAIRGGIRTVIIPEKNRRDVEELPRTVRRKLKFIPVSGMDQVLPLAVQGFAEIRKPAKKPQKPRVVKKTRIPRTIVRRKT